MTSTIQQRREATMKCLLGTLPVTRGLQKIIYIYKKLEGEGKLTRGPLDLQYRQYKIDVEKEKARKTKTGLENIRMANPALLGSRRSTSKT